MILEGRLKDEVLSPSLMVTSGKTVTLIGECIQLFFRYYAREGSSDISFRGDYLSGLIDTSGKRHERLPVFTYWTELVPGVRAKRKRTGDEEVTIIEVAQESCPISLCIMRSEGYRSKSGKQQENHCEEYSVKVLPCAQVAG